MEVQRQRIAGRKKYDAEKGHCRRHTTSGRKSVKISLLQHLVQVLRLSSSSYSGHLNAGLTRDHGKCRQAGFVTRGGFAQRVGYGLSLRCLNRFKHAS